jgi:hypothetical protein
VVRRRRASAAGDSVGLLDERHADPLVERCFGSRHQVASGHAAACAVPEHERRPRPVGELKVRVRLAVRRLDGHDCHRAMLAHVTPSGLNSLGSEIARLQTGFAGSARPFAFLSPSSTNALSSDKTFRS